MSDVTAHDFGTTVEVVGTQGIPEGVIVYTRHGQRADFEPARLATAPLVTLDPETDGATGYCKCGACGWAIDPWDRYCRRCGVAVVP